MFELREEKTKENTSYNMTKQRKNEKEVKRHYV